MTWLVIASLVAGVATWASLNSPRFYWLAGALALVPLASAAFAVRHRARRGFLASTVVLLLMLGAALLKAANT